MSEEVANKGVASRASDPGRFSIPYLPNSVCILYTNYQGKTSWRGIIPSHIWYGISCWHEQEGEQWLLEAFDISKQAMRSFAMKDIHQWCKEPPVEGDKGS